MKPKSCKWCKNKFTPTRPLMQACSFDCAIQLANKNGRDKVAKLQAKQREEMKERIKTLSDYKADLQKEVNTIVRLIDEGCKCISCNKPPAKINAGHFLSRGSTPHLRFHLFNIWLQCEYCNTYQHGNTHGFSSTLIVMNQLDFVIDLNLQYRDLETDKDQLKEATKTARQIVKDLIKINQVENLPRSVDRRIELRKNYNTALGIYL